MLKLNRKQLVNLATELKATKTSCNVYNNENICHYIEKLFTQNNSEELHKNISEEYIKDMQDIILKTLELKKQADSIYHSQIAYSCGDYGNTGQLRQLIFYKDGIEIYRYYLYY